MSKKVMITLMKEGVRTFEVPVNFHQTTKLHSVIGLKTAIIFYSLFVYLNIIYEMHSLRILSLRGTRTGLEKGRR